jgi:hypothetical protein
MGGHGFPDFHLLRSAVVGVSETITDGATCPFSPTAIQIPARYPAENVDAENGDNGLMVLPQVR